MNLLLLNTAECTGGAAVAASRLMAALQKVGIECWMLVRNKKTNNPNVISVNCSFIFRKINFIRFVWERFIIFLSNNLIRKNLFQVSIANTGSDISQLPEVRKADILHLHWINQGFLSLSDVERLIKTGKPIVWTMHDLWSATGICHYPDTCIKFQSQCDKCPLQAVSPIFDQALWTYQRKKKIGLNKVHFVGCSNWITEMARKSSLLQGTTFTTIPNPINTAVFKPIDKNESRALLRLPTNKFLLLFAAAKLSDKRKGASFLVEACQLLKEQYSDRLEIVLMGSSSAELCEALPFEVNILGYISDQETMVAAYSAADLFVIPSLEDNLPNTIMESMACGTPCVGFKTGGIPEMIDHKTNGYVAEYKNAEDLAAGIQWVLNLPDNSILSKACIEKVERCYSETVVAEQYINLYKQLLEKR